MITLLLFWSDSFRKQYLFLFMDGVKLRFSSPEVFIENSWILVEG